MTNEDLSLTAFGDQTSKGAKGKPRRGTGVFVHRTQRGEWLRCPALRDTSYAAGMHDQHGHPEKSFPRAYGEGVKIKASRMLGARAAPHYKVRSVPSILRSLIFVSSGPSSVILRYPQKYGACHDCVLSTMEATMPLMCRTAERPNVRSGAGRQDFSRGAPGSDLVRAKSDARRII